MVCCAHEAVWVVDNAQKSNIDDIYGVVARHLQLCADLTSAADFMCNLFIAEGIGVFPVPSCTHILQKNLITHSATTCNSANTIPTQAPD